jgi:hypothetical protein
MRCRCFYHYSLPVCTLRCRIVFSVPHRYLSQADCFRVAFDSPLPPYPPSIRFWALPSHQSPNAASPSMLDMKPAARLRSSKSHGITNWLHPSSSLTHDITSRTYHPSSSRRYETTARNSQAGHAISNYVNVSSLMARNVPTSSIQPILRDFRTPNHDVLADSATVDPYRSSSLAAA